MANAFFPRLTQPFFDKAGANLSRLLIGFLLLIFSTLIFVAIVLPLLTYFGFLK